MIKVEVIRKIQSYTLGIGGTGTIDWEVLLECGHTKIATSQQLQTNTFLLETECAECEKMATRDLEQFHVPEKQTSKTRTY